MRQRAGKPSHQREQNNYCYILDDTQSEQEVDLKNKQLHIYLKLLHPLYRTVSHFERKLEQERRRNQIVTITSRKASKPVQQTPFTHNIYMFS